MTSNRSLCDFEKATWLELETLCQSGVRDEIDVAIEVVIAKLENPLLIQKMWEWVKSGHKEIYDAIEMHRVITGRTTPEPVDDKSNDSAAGKSSDEEEEEEDSDELEEDGKSKHSEAAKPSAEEKESDKEEEDDEAKGPATRGTKRRRGK